MLRPAMNEGYFFKEVRHLDTFRSPDAVRRIKGWILPFVFSFLILASLTYVTLASLFRPLVWAMLLAFISYPLYTLLLRRAFSGRRGLAAMTMTLGVAALLALPMSFAAILIARESYGLFGKVATLVGALDASKGISLNALLPDVILKHLTPLFDEYPFLRDTVRQIAGWVTSTMVRLSQEFLSNLVLMLYHQVIIFVVYFFILRDGHRIVSYFRDIVPLMDDEREAFMSQADNVLRAVVFGVIVTAGVQGVLGALGWGFVGLPNPALAGALMALLAMIPFVGTPTVWIPGALYLFLSDDLKGALILAAWGLGVVSTVDNFLKPYFISEKAKMSTLLVFLGAFGGLAAWGFLGIFLGPLILSLFVFFLDSYRNAWDLYQQEGRRKASPRTQPPNDAPDSDTPPCKTA